MSVEELTNDPEFFQGDPNRPLLMDMDGRPMGLRDWAKAYEDTEGRTLKVTPAGDGEVRTVWHGIPGGDFMCLGSDNPEIFGSVIITPAADGHLSTYGKEILTGTREAALEAHELLVTELRQEVGPS